MKAYIYVPGDPSVGIFPIETTVDLCFDVDEEEEREEIRDLLKECFSEIYSVPVGIAFDDEMEKWRQRDLEMNNIVKQEEGM